MEPGTQLKGVILTHNHADFVAGHMELAERASSTIFISEEVDVSFRRFPAREGDAIVLSERHVLSALATPGHTPGCITWVLSERGAGDGGADRPKAAFTGDTLFVGSVGRPDLLGSLGFDKDTLAGMLFASLRDKLLALPDDVAVYPAHGAGSPCGKGMSDQASSTIGQERTDNQAVSYVVADDLDGFKEFVLGGMGAPPAYFLNVVELNLAGATPVDDMVAEVPRVSAEVFAQNRELIHAGGVDGETQVVVMDTRDASDFAAEHIPGSLNFPIGYSGGIELQEGEGNFGIWVGTMVDPKARILLITADGQEDETVVRLARVGYHGVVGILDGGIAAWKALGLEVSSPGRINLAAGSDLQALLDDPATVLLDVRNESEFVCENNGHVEGAVNIPLPDLEARLGELKRSTKYVAYCVGGYRSAIAVSYLKRAGYTAADIVGGYRRAIQPLARHLTTGLYHE